MYNNANKVPQYQRLFQSNPEVPIYLKTPRSKIMLYPFLGLFGFGLVGALYGLTKMARITLSFHQLPLLHRQPTLRLYAALLRATRRFDDDPPLHRCLLHQIRSSFHKYKSSTSLDLVRRLSRDAITAHTHLALATSIFPDIEPYTPHPTDTIVTPYTHTSTTDELKAAVADRETVLARLDQMRAGWVERFGDGEWEDGDPRGLVGRCYDERVLVRARGRRMLLEGWEQEEEEGVRERKGVEEKALEEGRKLIVAYDNQKQPFFRLRSNLPKAKGKKDKQGSPEARRGEVIDKDEQERAQAQMRLDTLARKLTGKNEVNRGRSMPLQLRARLKSLQKRLDLSQKLSSDREDAVSEEQFLANALRQEKPQGAKRAKDSAADDAISGWVDEIDLAKVVLNTRQADWDHRRRERFRKMLDTAERVNAEIDRRTKKENAK
ncbi:hypothetical protein PYCC9005_003627 [Savitreella phatthalungensis]